jgi:hypothetical protein
MRRCTCNISKIVAFFVNSVNVIDAKRQEAISFIKKEGKWETIPFAYSNSACSSV